MLVTVAHEVYLIDGEQMFSASPSDVRETCWWARDGGKDLTRKVCQKVGSFSDEDLENMLEKPPGIAIIEAWEIRSKLYEARNYAREFAF